MASTTVKQQTQLSTKWSETFLNGDVAGRFFWRISNVLRTRTETNRVTAAVTPGKRLEQKFTLSASPQRGRSVHPRAKARKCGGKQGNKGEKRRLLRLGQSVLRLFGADERATAWKTKNIFARGDSCCHPKTGFFGLNRIMKKHKMQNLRRKVHKFTDYTKTNESYAIIPAKQGDSRCPVHLSDAPLS